MNGFQRHRIKHLSASSINLWVNAPDIWVAKYLHGFKGTFGPAPRRGQCVEQVVHDVLTGADFETALKAGYASFDRDFLVGTDDTMKERKLIGPMAEVALEELKPFGVPQSGGDEQHRISITAKGDGWEIPVIGFLDLTYPDSGLVVDLKTTTRVPSKMSADHQLQRAIYAAAMGNAAVKFLYVSDKKAAWLEDGDVASTLARAKAHITRLERFLRLHSADTALSCVPCNDASFYWRDDQAALSEMFGLPA
jgi:hypothetical protein